MKFTPRVDQYIFMKDLELNPHRIDFKRISREWPPELGQVRPSISEIRRRIQALRDQAVEMGHVQYFSVKRVRSESTEIRDEQDYDEQHEDGGDPEDCTTLIAGSSAARNSQDQPGGSSRKQHRSSCSESEDLPDVNMLLGIKHKDEMQLRPISRPDYRGDDPALLDDDDEYELIVEELAEQRRDAQRAGKRPPATIAIQKTGQPSCLCDECCRSGWTPPTSWTTSPQCHGSSSQSLRRKVAQNEGSKPDSKPNGISKKLAEEDRRPPLPPQDEAYRHGKGKQLPPPQKAKVIPIEEDGPRSSKQSEKSVCTENKRRDTVLHYGNQTVEQGEEAGISVELQAQRTRDGKRCQAEKTNNDASLQAGQRGRQRSRHHRDSLGNETSDDSRKRPGRESWSVAGPKMPKWKRT